MMYEYRVWGLSRPNARGERTTFHRSGEGVVRVIELEPVLDLLADNATIETPEPILAFLRKNKRLGD